MKKMKNNGLFGVFFAVALAMTIVCNAPANASEPFLAEIMKVGFSFAPRGWALCDGQILPINQNQSLYSLLGTTYGGDGRTTFALPDLRGRVAIHPGDTIRLGQWGGAETVTLTEAQLPSHSHLTVSLRAHGSRGDQVVPGDTTVLARDARSDLYSTRAPDVNMSPNALAVVSEENVAGGMMVDDSRVTQPHPNMQPYLGINHVIALRGLFPSRD